MPRRPWSIGEQTIRGRIVEEATLSGIPPQGTLETEGHPAREYCRHVGSRGLRMTKRRPASAYAVEEIVLVTGDESLAMSAGW